MIRALLVALGLLAASAAQAQTPPYIVGAVATGDCVEFLSPAGLKDAGVGCGGGAGSAISSLTGDVTATGPGAAAATLATVNSGFGSVGSSTAIPVLTTNAKGLVTAQTTAVVIAPAGTLSGTTLNATVVSSSLTSFGNAPTIASPIITGTPSGAASTISINSTSCPLGGSCTVGFGSTISILNLTVTGTFTATGLVTVADLASSSTTVNGQTCTLGSTCTATAAAGTLTGTTLNSTVVTSSLTTVGTIGTGAWQGTAVALGYGGTNAALTASNGGIVYSTASAFAVLAGTVTAAQCLLSGSNTAPTWGSCSGAAAVSSVADSGAGTLTISPTTGSVVAALNLGNANTWTAAQTFTNSDIKLLGSSTGATTFFSANASATDYTLTFPAATDTIVVLGHNQTFTATETFSGTLNVSGTFEVAGISNFTPTVQSFTSGSGNYTPTAGTIRIRVRMSGPGGGGGAATTNTGLAGSAASSLGSWTATAGNGGAPNQSAGGTGGTGGTNGTGTLVLRLSGGHGQAGFGMATGGDGGANSLGGAGAGNSNAAGIGGVPNTGAGGGGGGGGTSGGGGGGSGEYVEFWVTGPGVLAYVVGAGGNGGAAGVAAGGAGAAGIIVIEEFYL